MRPYYGSKRQRLSVYVPRRRYLLGKTVMLLAGARVAALVADLENQSLSPLAQHMPSSSSGSPTARSHALGVEQPHDEAFLFTAFIPKCGGLRSRIADWTRIAVYG